MSVLNPIGNVRRLVPRPLMKAEVRLNPRPRYDASVRPQRDVFPRTDSERTFAE